MKYGSKSILLVKWTLTDIECYKRGIRFVILRNVKRERKYGDFTVQSLFLSLIFSNLCYRSPSLKAFCFDNRFADTTDPSVVRVAVRRTVL